MKIKLYIDFDGVILNTIETMEQMIEELGIRSNISLLRQFYLTVNWKDVIDKSIPLQHSIDNIKSIIASDLYEVAILTHVNSIDEGNYKKEYLKQYFSNLVVIPVLYPKPKYQVVDCKGAILVDDKENNLRLWKKHGGLAIQFSLEKQVVDWMLIDCLDLLIKEYDKILSLVSE